MSMYRKLVKLCLVAVISPSLMPAQSMASMDGGRIALFYESPKAGKIIDFVGDSTTEAAKGMYDRIAQQYAVPGGPLEGATIRNRGDSGNTLNRFVNNIAANGNTLDRVIRDKADLYVLSYGINDIRGSADAAGSTMQQIKADLKKAVDRLLQETNGFILLRIPNTFLSANSSEYPYLAPIENAQLCSDQLWEVYESFKGYSGRIDIIDIPSLVFGRTALPKHPLMQDILHPNEEGYRAIADALVSRISGKSRDAGLSQGEAALIVELCKENYAKETSQEGRERWHRMADEIRRLSGQPLE